MLALTRQSQSSSYQRGTGFSAGANITDIPWPKLRFSVWIEGLKAKYAVGDLVTLRQIPVRENMAPMAWNITYINELHKDCKFDTDISEPICISVAIHTGITMHKCPGVLRKLTVEEIALVKLSHQKSAGSA